jgi:carbon-monoxide dehydrogenase medium subunit
MDVDLDGREMVTAITFPNPEPPRCWAYEAFCRRHGDYAMVSVALAFDRDAGGAVRGLRIGVGGAGPVPQRLDDLEQEAEGTQSGPDWALALAQRVAAAVTAEDDRRGSQAYRRELVQTLTARALSRALATSEVT